MTLVAKSRQSVWDCELARIVDIRHETCDVSTYDFSYDERLPKPRNPFEPGQFNMLYLPGFGEAAISLSSDPAKSNTFSHTVRRLGNVTGALARLSVGDQIGVRGPFGTPWPVDRLRYRDVVIACGGLGLAPLRPVIYHIIGSRKRFGRVKVVYGARSPDELLYRNEFDSWRNAGVEVIVTVDIDAPGWNGAVGVVPGLIDELDVEFDTAAMLTCGPEIMMRYVVREALERGVDPRSVYLAMERNMSCGMAFCGRCQVGPFLLCRDGPVLCYDAVAPLLNLEDL